MQHYGGWNCFGQVQPFQGDKVLVIVHVKNDVKTMKSHIFTNKVALRLEKSSFEHNREKRHSINSEWYKAMQKGADIPPTGLRADPSQLPDPPKSKKLILIAIFHTENFE